MTAQACIYWLGDAPDPDAQAWVVDASRFDQAPPGADFARAVLRLGDVGARDVGRDLARPLAAGIDVLMLPGVRDIADVCVITERCPQTVMPVIDNLQALDQMRAIAHLPGVARLVFDALAVQRALGVEHEDALLVWRAQLVLASRLAGLPPPVDDSSLPPARVRQLGFGACLCRDATDLVAARLAFGLPRSDRPLSNV